MTTVGLGTVEAKNLREKIYMIVAILLGLTFYSFVIGSLSSLVRF